ncbi:prolyl oligopeptidase family serine peptidase [Parabacteroides sp. OttesenSCG-928-N08]|nr:prolyl oligopeptidase family serine peptidase [Parabacteroides sp. OttesenSCG-928-N08]
MLYVSFSFLFGFALHAQQNMTVDNLTQWQRISQQTISDDGQWVACKIEPWVGDATVKLFNRAGEEVASYSPAANYHLSASAKQWIVTLTPGKEETDSLNRIKTKEDKMPMNRVVIRQHTGEELFIDSIRNLRVSQHADWMAYQQHRKDSTLYIRTTDGQFLTSFNAVSDYQFAEKGAIFRFLSAGDTLGRKAGLYLYDLNSRQETLIKEGKGEYKQLTFNKEGNLLAFLYCEEKKESYKAMELWLSTEGKEAQLIAERGNEAFPEGWVISENGELSFSDNNRRLFFGTAPEPQQVDSTRLADEWPNVQVWSWNEPVQYTVQNYNKANDLKKSYRALYAIAVNRLMQLGSEELPQLQIADQGNGEWALLSTSRPYSLSSMWEGKTRSDYYSISLETGEKQLLKEASYARPRFSPKGDYLYWYAQQDSSWYTFSMREGKECRLTTPQSFEAWDSDFDTPDYPDAYGTAGWSNNDEAILILDRYDIWQFDPKAKKEAVNLTQNGRNKRLKYRLVTLDKEQHYIDTRKPQILTAFDEVKKTTGYFRTNLSKPTTPTALVSGDFRVHSLAKAKDADVVIYKQETFADYPEIRLADIAFKKPLQLTRLGKQQEQYIWGTAELVTWNSYDGIQLEGVLYKPTNFDPTKRYPMIVNFYERNADTFHNYHTPDAHRSTIDYMLYLSNGYLIFNPDVRYRDGYPGESAFNCVMPGITMLIDRGYINEKAIGAQGHSWGAYQVAYLATRTRLFAAIESGAPVVNMFSAFGGIRWGSGLARSFQYEHTQSRIGGSIWETPMRYFENSPLFAMDKVETPILIMHNDHDGHVPWYQGIEYFVALKRLGKPAWLLNYPGEIHWPMKMANRIDFQKRMFQFFNHYLKQEPMPQWMKEGLPAVKQDFELGY